MTKQQKFDDRLPSSDHLLRTKFGDIDAKVFQEKIVDKIQQAYKNMNAMTAKIEKKQLDKQNKLDRIAANPAGISVSATVSAPAAALTPRSALKVGGGNAKN